MLERFAVAHLNLSISGTGEIIDRMADAVMETHPKIPGHMADHPEFQATGEAMMVIWERRGRDLVEI